MHVKSLHFLGFKRFTDTRIENIPPSARLVVLAGPNGSGKSSIFDGMKNWHYWNGGVLTGIEEAYIQKVGTPTRSIDDHVFVNFHEPIPDDATAKKKLVYARTAFRNEADFNISSFSRLDSPLNENRASRMIDTDATVSQNYQRLIMQTVDGVFDSSLSEDMPRSELRDRIIGRARTAVSSIFPDLVLDGVGGLASAGSLQGSFYFTKGESAGFLYKNLSAGEKSAFDLLLDCVIKSSYFDDSVWCIDEPETHLNSRVQSLLLHAMLQLLPENCQLWLASHSIGFMKQAWELSRAQPDDVCFIDLEGHDFDQAVVIEPVKPSREFWSRTLRVALGDLAALVAPSRVILCEGRPQTGANDVKAAFDAACYRTIFSEKYPDVDFVSVGSASEAVNDRLGVAHALQTITPGTVINRLIDRDSRSQQEIEILEQEGTRVLGRRHLEAYLLDDEVIEALCREAGMGAKVADALEVKQRAIADSVARGNDADDVKRAAGSIRDGLRKLLSLATPGSTPDAFLRDTMAPLVREGMAVYSELEAIVLPEESGS
ncbi:hypothetical protein NS220_09565 [Microbacterium testaceum]|uniref:ATPase AAA-type core domain-containing protein n=1 Tax=Microbacterium testaceum TaxID=2033 RepID=A0A147EWN7_MICTE|nr:hypothetical protein NS220_09565 [Microbacterium testaceum]